DVEVPDWLRDISAEDTGEGDITVEPFSFEGATGAPQRTESAGPPAWLSTEDSPEAVPDWLRRAVHQSEALAGAAPEMPDVPAWLREPEPPTQPPTAADVPPWLQQEPTSADAASTSFTQAQDDDTLPGIVPGGMAAGSAVPAQTPPEPADDLPDWLRPSAP